MKKLIIIITVLFTINVSAQTVETVGSGVLDFLLSNPKTANKMNESESIALGILSGLLKTSANRKHQLNVAETGKTEIVLNSGNQSVTIGRGPNGEVYFISNGRVIPFSQSFIDQAEGISGASSSLQGYNISQIQEEYYSELEEDYERFIVIKRGKIMYDDYKKALEDENLKILKEGRITQKMRDGKRYLAYFSFPSWFKVKRIFGSKVQTIFTANWSRDMDNNGLQFPGEFHGIKRSFEVGEKLVIYAPTLIREDEKDAYIQIAVLDAMTGNVLVAEDSPVSSSNSFPYLEISNIDPGRYLASVKLIVNGKSISAMSVEFEVFGSQD